MECPILSSGVVGRNPGREGAGGPGRPTVPPTRSGPFVRPRCAKPAGPRQAGSRVRSRMVSFLPRSHRVGFRAGAAARTRDDRGSQGGPMTSLGVMILVASAATGFDGKADVGRPALLPPRGRRPTGPPPPGGPIQPGMMGGPGMGPDMGPPARWPAVASPTSRARSSSSAPEAPAAPADMKIGWQTGGRQRREGLSARPARPRSATTSCRAISTGSSSSEISGRPTLNALPDDRGRPDSTPATDAYLTHNQIPDPVHGRGPRPGRGRELRHQGHLPARPPLPGTGRGQRRDAWSRPAWSPGVDPVLEADKRGTILLIVRLGGINLEMDSGHDARRRLRPT